MKYIFSDKRLLSIVDDLGEEYKELLIERILDDMNESDVDLINTTDLIRLDVQIKSNLRVDRKTQRRNRILHLYSLIGSLYAVIGLMMLMFNEIKDSVRYEPMSMMALILIFVGLFFSLFSLLARSMQRVRPKNYTVSAHKISPYEITNKWREIEALIFQLTPESSSLSLNSMIQYLEENRIISRADVTSINQLLSLRNQIVHGHQEHTPQIQSEFRSILQEVNRIIDKLKMWA